MPSSRSPFETPHALASAAGTEAAVVAHLASRAGALTQVPQDSDVFSYIDADGQPAVLDVEKYREEPRRTRGTVVVRDVDSFAGYTNKHLLPGQTEVWADTTRSTVTAVINAAGPSPAPPQVIEESTVADEKVEQTLVTAGRQPGENELGWGDHRAQLQLVADPDWVAWTKNDQTWWEQEDFAEFVVQHGANVHRPDGATMLELVQSFNATKKAAFESSRRIANGQVQLTYKEDIEAKAGKSGHLEIPERLELVLRPYEHSTPVKLGARFRYRIDQANLRLGYVLDRPADVQREAFKRIVEDVHTKVPAPVFFGTSDPIR